MLQHRRRTFAVVGVALSLVYLCTLFSRSSYDPRRLPLWAHPRPGRYEEVVLNGTLGFAEIFVINLPSRLDRREAMLKAGAVSNLNLTILEAFSGADDSVPPSTSVASQGATARKAKSSSAGARGSWNSHKSAIQTIVDRRLGGALVLEDDVDWDVRLKTQMTTFAEAARMWLDIDLDTTERDEKRQLVARAPAPAQGRETNIPIPQRRGRSIAGSPYGDGWDILWLGHCGADLPSPFSSSTSSSSALSSSSSSSSSPLIIPLPNDTTVPSPQHLKPHPFALRDKLAAAYPPHTRVVHAAAGNVCSLAYAVSPKGATKLLRWLRRGRGEEFAGRQWDLMLRDWCMGETWRDMGRGWKERDSGGTAAGHAENAGGRRSNGQEGENDDGDGGGDSNEGSVPICLTVQPPLFSHRYAGEKGGASVSDIRGQGGGMARGKKGTPYVRLSVQENMARLEAGYPVGGLVDQLPDDGEPLW
ncbi:hypothetical protein F4808DRAFT_467357 [Astrocystis sublimbata]|nr:hypothetical protein F4808DRAFT_467357 [Astrocystis sublimbata]